MRVIDSVFPDRKVIRLEEAASTNSYLLQLSAKQNLPEGTAVVADNQTRGRGQGDNSWESAPGRNLTFSIILYPRTVKGADQFLLSKTAALAVRDFAVRRVSDVSVKWPNDVYVGERKIAGILIENFIEGAYLTRSVIGIGLNVNQEEFHGDAPNPVSLRQLTGCVYDLAACLEELVESIADRYGMIAGRRDQLHTDYLQYLYRAGKLCKYAADGEIFEAVVTGVNKYGMIEMTTSENKRKTFAFKEVRFL